MDKSTKEQEKYHKGQKHDSKKNKKYNKLQILNPRTLIQKQAIQTIKSI